MLPRRKNFLYSVLAFAVVIACCVLSVAVAQASTQEIIVGRQPGLSIYQRADVRADADVQLVSGVAYIPGSEIVQVDAENLADALKQLNDDPRVRWAQPNRRVSSLVINDPLFAEQWGLSNPDNPGMDIGITGAWTRSTGSGVTVAVVDSGVQTSHPDLSGNIVSQANNGEVPGNRIDDDHNGFVDDVNGWNWISNNASIADDNGHGTHVAGIIAATQNNNIGGSGVAPDAKLLALKALDGQGGGNLDDVASAFAYAGQQGARVVSASLGGNMPVQQLLVDAIKAHPNTLYVVAAGNEGADLSAGSSADQAPCNTPLPNVLCVGALGASSNYLPLCKSVVMPHNFCVASYSNYSDAAGPVKIYAPGSDIKSTWLAGTYRSTSGTSMATPFVAGTAALVASLHPSWDGAQIRQRLLDKAALADGLWRFSDGNSSRVIKVLDAAGATASTQDEDSDGVVNVSDNCPTSSNPDQQDTDGDGIGDSCDSTPRGADPDNDGFGSVDDNCPSTRNPVQLDTDEDGLGDACDSTPHGADPDGDGIGNLDDNCPNDKNPGQQDYNRNDIGDACDPAVAVRFVSSRRVKNGVRMMIWTSASGRAIISLRNKVAGRWITKPSVSAAVKSGQQVLFLRLGKGSWNLTLSLKGKYGNSRPVGKKLRLG